VSNLKGSASSSNGYNNLGALLVLGKMMRIIFTDPKLQPLSSTRKDSLGMAVASTTQASV